MLLFYSVSVIYFSINLSIFIFVRYDRRPDPFIRKDFQKQAVRDTSVQNMHPVDSFPDGIRTVAQLRQHAPSDTAAADQLLSL